MDPLVVPIVVATCLGCTLNLISLYMFGSLGHRLVNRKTSSLLAEVSPSLVIYVGIEITYAFSSAVYFAFLCVETILHNGRAYNAYFLFGSGTLVTVLLELIPVAVVFLSLDRCLCIRRPAMKHEKSKLVYFNCLAIVVIALVIIFADIISSVPSSATTTCSAFACLSTQTGKGVYGIVRMTLGIINILMCIVLAAMIRRKLALPALAAKTNTVVLKTVLITLLFDFLPHFAAFLLATAIHKDVTQNYGPLSGLVSAVDNCLCACLYYRTVKPRSKVDPHLASRHFFLPSVS